MALLKGNRCCAKASRCPGKQDVDGNKRSLIVGECLAQLRAEEAECAHVSSHIGTNGCAQRKSRDARSQSAHEPVLFVFRRAINNIESLFQSREQARDLFGWMLQIVI